MVTDSASLVLVANAGDGSISSFRFDGEALELLAVTEGLTSGQRVVLSPPADLSDGDRVSATES